MLWGYILRCSFKDEWQSCFYVSPSRRKSIYQSNPWVSSTPKVNNVVPSRHNYKPHPKPIKPKIKRSYCNCSLLGLIFVNANFKKYSAKLFFLIASFTSLIGYHLAESTSLVNLKSSLSV